MEVNVITPEVIDENDVFIINFKALDKFFNENTQGTAYTKAFLMGEEYCENNNIQLRENNKDGEVMEFIKNVDYYYMNIEDNPPKLVILTLFDYQDDVKKIMKYIEQKIEDSETN